MADEAGLIFATTLKSDVVARVPTFDQQVPTHDATLQPASAGALFGTFTGLAAPMRLRVFWIL